MPGQGMVPQPCILVPASDLYSRRHTETRSLRLNRKKDTSKGFCGFSNISLGPAQTNISSRIHIQLLFFPAFLQIHVVHGVPQDQAAATCTVLEQQLQSSFLTSGWSCQVGAVGPPGATAGLWWVVSGTCPQLLLSAGKK